MKAALEIPNSRVVVEAPAVDAAFQKLAAAVQPIVDEGSCVLLGVLLGGLVPLARLAGLLHGDFVMDACRVARYGDALRGGVPQWVMPPKVNLADRHVVIVDDIYDEGVTLEFLLRHCEQAGAARVTTLVLVRKRHPRALASVQPDLVGLEVGDDFVFGCGMDHRGHWRHLPDIRALKG